MEERSGSLPYMELDELPEDVVGIDDAFLDNYLRGVEADAAVSGLLPSLNLDDAFWLDKPSPAQIQHHIQQQQQQQPQPPHQRVSLHLASDNSHGSGDPHAAAPVAAAAAGSGGIDSLQEPHDPVGHGASVESNELNAEHPPPRGARRSSSAAGRKVTPQRKQNNRKAQQRYREKRKMQAANLEQQVVSLTAELQVLQTVRDSAARTEAENAKLKAEMQAQQDELARLRSTTHGAHTSRGSGEVLAHLDSRRSRDSSGSHPTVALDDLSDDHPDAGSAGVPGRGYERVVEEIMVIKSQIQAVLRSAGLPDDHTSPGQELDAQLLAQLRDLLTHAEKVSVSMLLMAPMCPMTKVLRHRAALGDAHPCSHFRSRWIKILAALHLTVAQEDLLLGGRQELLDRLRSIYEERSQLNQITMSIMLPRRSLDSDGDKDCGTTEGKIKKAARYGAGCMLSQTAELVTALDRLKANLSSERRMLVQLHASLVRKVLTPLQAAVMFVQADTDPVEPLHIGNLIAMNRGLAEQPPMLPPLEPHEEELLMRPYSSMAAAVSGGTVQSMLSTQS